MRKRDKEPIIYKTHTGRKVTHETGKNWSLTDARQHEEVVKQLYGDGWLLTITEYKNVFNQYNYAVYLKRKGYDAELLSSGLGKNQAIEKFRREEKKLSRY